MIHCSRRSYLCLAILLTSVPVAYAASPVELPAVSPEQTVRFTQRPTRVGDRVGQELAVGLDVTSKFTQAGQIAHQSDTTMRREQTRLIEVLEAPEGQLLKARVAFPVSRVQRPEEAAGGELQPQPIEGKAYLATRRGEQLTITDAHGEMPPLEEYRAAREALETLGKPNLLASFLLERPIRVGERMLVPRAIARSLLGVGDELGAIKRFELQLLAVEPAEVPEASPRAVFTAKIETMANEQSPVELIVEGQVKIETETCRTVAANLEGPVQMSSIEQTAAGVFQFEATGALKVAIRSQYGTLR